MNGGRLSDDEAFFLGIRQFREEMAATGDAERLQRPLRMIAVRYPEEAGQIQARLETAASPLPEPLREQLEELLVQVEQQYQEDFAD